MTTKLSDLQESFESAPADAVKLATSSTSVIHQLAPTKDYLDQHPQQVEVGVVDPPAQGIICKAKGVLQNVDLKELMVVLFASFAGNAINIGSLPGAAAIQLKLGVNITRALVIAILFMIGKKLTGMFM